MQYKVLKIEVDDNISDKIEVVKEDNPISHEYIIRVKEKDDKVPISGVGIGQIIKFCGRDWVVVEQDKDLNAFVVSNDIIANGSFGKTNIYYFSDVRELLGALSIFDKDVFSTEPHAFQVFSSDVMALDGTMLDEASTMYPYNKTRYYVSSAMAPMSLDMYRKWRYCLPKYKDDFWLITPCTYENNEHKNLVTYVDRKTGCIERSPCHFRHGVVAVCKLSADTKVEVVNE